MLKVRELPNPNGKMEKTLFIPAFLEDNPLGVEKDPAYESRLMARDDTTAKALRWGMWSVFAGQMFSEFVKVRHTCKPFEIPAHWSRWRSVDWGFAAPWSVHWWTRKPENGRLYVYRELYRVGVLDPHQAQLIKEYSTPDEKFLYTLADPSMWIRKTDSDQAKSTADVYAANGVLLTKANNDNQTKISKTHSALGNMYDDMPAVMIFDTCEALIRTIPTLVRDPKNPEMLMQYQEDHAWDDFAYGLTNWMPPVLMINQQQKREPAPNPWLKVKNI